MQIEKEFLSLDPLSFERIEDYLAHIKELQWNWGECSKNFPKKDDHLIELILMNMNTPYDILCSTFHTSWASRKEYGKDVSFDSFCGLFIRAHEKLLDDGKLEIKQQAHLFQGKSWHNYKEKGRQCN